MPMTDTVARELLLRPRPVLCLDTCELLMAVQCLPQRRIAYVEALNRILTSLVSDPGRLKVIVTELVVVEWGQNIAEVQLKASKFLTQLDEDVMLVQGAWSHLVTSPTTSPSSHAGSTLVHHLTQLGRAVMGLADVLDRDAACFERAFARVLARRRPSHEGRIKDSIHLEHYLELSRRLHAGGYPERRVFVSGNRTDFWEGSSSRIHPALGDDFAAVGLEFFGDLRSAVGSLGI